MTMIHKPLAASAVVLIFCGIGSVDARSDDQAAGTGNSREAHYTLFNSRTVYVGGRTRPSNPPRAVPAEKPQSPPPSLARQDISSPALAKDPPTPPSIGETIEIACGPKELAAAGPAHP